MVNGVESSIMHNNKFAQTATPSAILEENVLKLPAEKKWHLSYDCVKDSKAANVNTEGEIPHATNYPPETDPENTEDLPLEIPLPDDDMNGQQSSDLPQTGTKQHLPTDLDSDNNKPQPQRRPRIKPTPNLTADRSKKAKPDSPKSQQVQ